MRYKKTFRPMIEHRPPVREPIPTAELVHNLGYSLCPLAEQNDLSRLLDLENETVPLLIGGGMVPQSVCRSFSVINSHPGYLPYVRGLDALKWAIYKELPVGVTTHLLGEGVDDGILIQRSHIEVSPQDTFHGVAYRVYETEIQMLVDAVELYTKATIPLENDPQYPPRRRMPNELELEMLRKFDLLKISSK
jgi:phosphoribosylglycinamide formyltransferase-1